MTMFNRTERIAIAIATLTPTKALSVVKNKHFASSIICCNDIRTFSQHFFSAFDSVCEHELRNLVQMLFHTLFVMRKDTFDTRSENRKDIAELNARVYCILPHKHLCL